MSLEKILERIEQDAQGEVDRIKSRASKTADEILKKAQDEAEALQAQALEDAMIEAEQRKERLISTAKLDLRKARLAEKQDAIDAAFREAVESLLNMEDAEYRSIMRGMILPNVQTGDEEIILSERDRAGFIVTGPDLMVDGKRPKGWNQNRDPFLLETSVPGIFAAGDVRHHSMKRVASAVGEGAVAVALVHQYLKTV